MTEDLDDNELDDEGLLVYTAKDILKIGLWLVGYKKRRIWHAKETTNVERFWGHHTLVQIHMSIERYGRNSKLQMWRRLEYAPQILCRMR
jgi:hypothetical protein